MIDRTQLAARRCKTHAESVLLALQQLKGPMPAGDVAGERDRILSGAVCDAEDLAETARKLFEMLEDLEAHNMTGSL